MSYETDKLENMTIFFDELLGFFSSKNAFAIIGEPAVKKLFDIHVIFPQLILISIAKTPSVRGLIFRLDLQTKRAHISRHSINCIIDQFFFIGRVKR